VVQPKAHNFWAIYRRGPLHFTFTFSSRSALCPHLLVGIVDGRERPVAFTRKA
jgi:hypothetical protein